MTAPIWPSTLPHRVLRDGYSEAGPDGRLRQPMSTGPAKVRRLTSAAVREVQVSLLLSPDQRATLDGFWDDDLAGGVRAFWFPDQVRDGVVLDAEEAGVSLGPMLTEDEEEILIDAWWLARFGEGGLSFEPAGIPGYWIASLTLEVLP